MARIEPSKARQVYLLLRDRITAGMAVGSTLPPEQVLAAEHAVSRITVRRALAELEREGLILRRQGAGTFVRMRHTPSPVIADLSDMLANIEAMGRTTQVRLLSFGYRRPLASVASALNLPAGESVQHSIRVRLIDGQPMSHLTTHVPARIGMTYSEEELASRPLLSLIERSGIVVARATQEIGAVLASPDVAHALEVEVGSALVALTRIIFDESARGIEHLFALYRPDRYALRMDLVRAEGANGKRWVPANDASAVPQAEVHIQERTKRNGRAK